MDGMFLEKLSEALSLENVKYYYHVTNQDSELIMNEGLFMVGNRIEETAIEIPKEFKENPIEYCEGEKGLEYRKNPSIIIIAIDKDEIEYLIKPIEFYPSNWNHDEMPNNYIESRYILGYINTNNYDLVLNENFDYNNELYLR